MESQHIDIETQQRECSPDPAGSEPGLTRRDLLRGATSAPALALGGSAVAATLLAPGQAAAEVLLPLSLVQRRNQAYKRRTDAAHANREQWKNAGPQATNNDETYGDKRGSFTKCLPHNAIGEVDAAAYAAFRAARLSGDPDDFEAIPFDPTAQRKLNNPQAALAYTMTGLDPQFGRIAAAPAFASLETAAEMGELYWAALTRDVPFRQYSVDPLIGQAVADLNGFSQPVGPKSGGLITAGTLFRGSTAGDLVGPFVSQLLWKPAQLGSALIEQRYRSPTPVDFMTTFPEWLANQRGANPTSELAYLPGTYIHDGRTLGEYVHYDQLYQAFIFAGSIMEGMGPDAIAPGNPYVGSATQMGFVTHGGFHFLDLIARAANLGLRASWWQKWQVHNRLRPDTYGGRLTVQLQGTKYYGLPADIVNSDAVSALLSAHGNALLPQAYPESSPNHPAYPGGHSVYTGACCTVLKALFNESFVIPDPVEATDDGSALDPWTGAALTLGGEIDKLAFNICQGRDTAGLHWRSDAHQGLLLGEQVALAMLADETRTLNEDFGGYELTRFDGTPVLVAEGEVYV